MTCPRYRYVVIAGRRYLFFADALVVAAGAQVFSADPEAPEGDDRAEVLDRDRRPWRVHFHPPEEDEAAEPGDLLGFVLDGEGEGASIAFADGRTTLRRVSAVIRRDDLVEVWKPPCEYPVLFRPRPYPWAR